MPKFPPDAITDVCPHGLSGRAVAEGLCPQCNALKLREPTAVPSPLSIQVGGTHYKSMSIQPVEFITQNGLGFLEGCIIKRLSRYRRQGGGGMKDLLKCRHEIDLLIQHWDREAQEGRGLS